MTQKNAFDFFEYHNQISQENILLSYKGPLTDRLLAEFSRDIREKVASNPKSGKKVFAIFMELAQNVLFYSKEENFFEGNRDKIGTLVILQTENHYRLITGNMVFKKNVESLLEKCEVINSLNREELRKYKRTLRSQPQAGESRGAGIGLVQAALTSNNPLEVRVKELEDDFAFFILMVNVEKNT